MARETLTPVQVYRLIADVYRDKRGSTIPIPNAIAATAIVLKESGGDTGNTNINDDGSIDRGLWQWNSRWHPEISESDAFDKFRSTEWAYDKSSGFSLTGFGPWIGHGATTLEEEFNRTQNNRRALQLATGAVNEAPNAGLSAAELDQVRQIIERIDRQDPTFKLYTSGHGTSWAELSEEDRLKAARIVRDRYSGSITDAEEDLLNRYAEGSEPGAGELIVDSAGGLVDIVTSPFQGIIDAVVGFFHIITSADFWKRVGLGALGLFVIIVAILLYNKDKVASIITKGKM